MSSESFEQWSDLTGFDGHARLFPLPDVTIYPNVVQPLHIFEPRYRAMLDAAMESDQLIAMAVLRSGWEGAEEPLPIERSVCLGRVVSHATLADGRSNIMLLGLRRAKIRRELPQRELYREADIELQDDHYSPEGAATRATIQRALLERFRRLLPDAQTTRHEQLERIAQANASLGLLTDVVASVAPIAAELKLELLSQNNVDHRAARLLEALELPPQSPYNWEFSEN